MTTLSRLSYQQQEDQMLADYAIKSSMTRGRQHPEKEHDLRTPFQRDRDRIIHSTAFRRLQYKTQVFVNHEGDHYRTRLTHTLETCQIARTIARVLRLNEDLVEAIALAHDLGHGPFGHAGEWALEELMKDHGGFEHNVQSLRIVEKLEESYVEFPGLNLTFEAREGLKKHPEKFYPKGAKRFRSLEAELVDVSDEIAYNSHDLDDGLRSGLIDEKQMDQLEFWNICAVYIRKKYKHLSPVLRRRLTIRLMINRLVKDVIEQAQTKIASQRLTSLEQLQSIRVPVIGFSMEVKRYHAQLKKFLHKNLYQHPYVVRMTDKGQRFLKALFTIYAERPNLLPIEVRQKMEQKGNRYRAVCDYVAGMTDRFAIDEYRRLFEPWERV